jgi:hypothetical protein
MLPLLPIDPIACADVGPGQPASTALRARLAVEPCRECDVGELDSAAAQPAERAKLVQLAQAVEAVPRRRSLRDDETSLLEVTKHASRPSGRLRRGSYGQPSTRTTLAQM